MGAAAARVQLAKAINTAFNNRNIGQTAKRLRTLSPRADFLDISEAIGVLDDLHRGNFSAYRKQLTIPRLIQRGLTIAYREALFHKPEPIPLHIDINVGRKHAVEIKVTDQLISVVLTRPDPPSRKSG